jgi:hypothetical protein
MPKATMQGNYAILPGAGNALDAGFNRALGNYQKPQIEQQMQGLSDQQTAEYQAMIKELTTPGTRSTEQMVQGQGPLLEPPVETVKTPLSPLEESQRRLGVYGEMSRLPMARKMAEAGIKSEVDFPEKQALREQAMVAAREKQASDQELRRMIFAGQQSNAQQGFDIRREGLNIQRDKLSADAADREAKAGAKADAAKPASEGSIRLLEENIGLIDTMVGKRGPNGELLPGSRTHPGFNQAVGFGFPGLKYAHGTDTAGFAEKHERIKANARVEGIASLRGTGAVSNAEGQAAANASNDMSMATNEREYVDAAMRYRSAMQAGIDRRQRGLKIAPDGVTEIPIGAPEQGGAQQQSAPSQTAVHNGVTYVKANGKWYAR